MVKSRGLALLAAIALAAPAHAEAPAPAAAEFFEKEVRPLLVERCLRCHNDAKARGGLRLNSRAAVLKGGNAGPAVLVGKPEASLLIQAILHGEALKMPPKEKLKDREIETLTRWVSLGLPWPEGATLAAPSDAKFVITDEQRRFWAWQPVKVVPPPSVRHSTWARCDLDRYILAGLEAKGLKPAPPADRRALIRRATFDLTGLPPAPAAIDAFLADHSPDAFAKVVGRLLASPEYGQRWGRRWLDVVRYTDSFDARGLGGQGDCSEAWRYRDWVVDAFNRDLPYDQFVIRQIAGDIAPPSPGAATPGLDGVVATGMLAIGNWGGGDADKDKLLTDIADDQIDVVSKAFLGVTLSCARCHDHKFDPFSQEDYYGLAGIFFSTHILPDVGKKTDGPPMLFIPIGSKEEQEKYRQYEARLADLEKQLKAAGGKQPGTMKLAAEIDALKKSAPPLTVANGAQEGGVPGSPHAGFHDVRVHIRGRYDRLGDLVPRRFPTILAGEKQPQITEGSGRLQLARWLASADNPLTARVMVNRIWQGHFGQGIVRSPSNFGKLGERPTHPELLDWLADQFVRGGWSVKKMHRLMMLSATYQQASEPDAETLKADPDNRLFGHMNRRRLEAEEVRDSLLAVSGRLDPALGGKATRDFNSPRRTLYQMTVRSDRSGFGPLFDVADPTAPADHRNVSTVAPQALFLMNHPFAREQAKGLARRLAAGQGSDAERIGRAYVLLYGRPATEEEVKVGLALVGAGGEAAWAEYCQVLLCANEFVYMD